MKALLLAAGKGTRLHPLTRNIPKVMIPINGKPLIEYHLEQFAQGGIDEVIINLHHMPEKIRDFIGKGEKWGVSVKYSFETEILGTAGAVKKVEAKLKKEPFLVVYGDNFIELDYKDFIQFSERKKGMAIIAVFEKEDVTGSGILDIGKNDEVLCFLEKPQPSEIFSHWVNAGVYYFKKKIFDFIPQKFSDFGFDVLPAVLKQGEKLYTYKLKNRVWGIDTSDLLEKLKKEKELQ